MSRIPGQQFALETSGALRIDDDEAFLIGLIGEACHPFGIVGISAAAMQHQNQRHRYVALRQTARNAHLSIAMSEVMPVVPHALDQRQRHHYEAGNPHQPHERPQHGDAAHISRHIDDARDEEDQCRMGYLARVAALDQRQ
jgi:hypothetical protein